jgi:hypothetical protein
MADGDPVGDSDLVLDVLGSGGRDFGEAGFGEAGFDGWGFGGFALDLGNQGYCVGCPVGRAAGLPSAGSVGS